MMIIVMMMMMMMMMMFQTKQGWERGSWRPSCTLAVDGYYERRVIFFRPLAPSRLLKPQGMASDPWAYDHTEEVKWVIRKHMKLKKRCVGGCWQKLDRVGMGSGHFQYIVYCFPKINKMVFDSFDFVFWVFLLLLLLWWWWLWLLLWWFGLVVFCFHFWLASFGVGRFEVGFHYVPVTVLEIIV